MGTQKAKEIKLSNLLKEKFINLTLDGETKEEVVAELVKLIAQSKKLKSKKTFYNAILEREGLGSTGIGNGVAIPHAKTKVADDFIIAFARKDEGIDFGALDGEKTFLFFILASPKEEIGGHLKILAEISRLVKDKFIVELLRKAKDRKEILKIIADVEKYEK
jgi:fructose-specific phosphotransferase system IIA component